MSNDAVRIAVGYGDLDYAFDDDKRSKDFVNYVTLTYLLSSKLFPVAGPM